MSKYFNMQNAVRFGILLGIITLGLDVPLTGSKFKVSENVMVKTKYPGLPFITIKIVKVMPAFQYCIKNVIDPSNDCLMMSEEVLISILP